MFLHEKKKKSKETIVLVLFTKKWLRTLIFQPSESPYLCREELKTTLI